MNFDSITILPGEPVPQDVIFTPCWEVQFDKTKFYSDQPYQFHTDQGEYSVIINTEEEPWDPRENDNLGTMICWHRRYNLGDIQGNKKYPSATDFMEEAKAGKYIMLPLALLDHSGISIYEGKGAHVVDPGGWDSGQIGWIYVTPEKIKADNGWKHLTAHRIEEVKSWLRSEIKEYDDYLTGNCYRFNIEHEDGSTVNNVGGYLGDIKDSGILIKIKAEIRADIQRREGKQKLHIQYQLERLKNYIKFAVPIYKRKPFIL